MPKSAQAYAQGVAAFERQDFDAAREWFLQVNSQDPRHYPRTLPFLGRICLQQGDSTQALEYLRSAAGRLDTPEAYFEYGEALFRLNEMPQAEQAFQTVVSLDPRFTDGFIRLGMIFHRRKQLTEAIRYFEQAIVLDTRALVARYFLAQLCLETDNKKRALSQLHLVLQINPDYGPAHVLMGDVCQSLGDHRQALVEYCHLANSQLQDPGVYVRMARSFKALDDPRQMMQALERAFRLRPSLSAVGLQVAQHHEAQRHFRTALGLYRQLLANNDVQELATEAVARLEAALGIVPESRDEEDGTGEAPASVVLESAEEETPFVFDAPMVRPSSAKTLPLRATTPQATKALDARLGRTAPLSSANQFQSFPPALRGLLTNLSNGLRRIDFFTQQVRGTLEARIFGSPKR